MKGSEYSQHLFEVDSSFTDYPKFEIDKKDRAEQKKLFIDGIIYVPNYRYHELNTLYDTKIDEETGKQSVLSAKKMAIQYAVMELDSLKRTGEIDENLAELQSAFYELRLKRILLVEGARSLLHNNSSDRQESLRGSFMEVNRELYGEFNEIDFYGLLSTEFKRIVSSEKTDPTSLKIINELKTYFDGVPIDLNQLEEIELLDKKIINEMYPIIRDQYSYIWDCVPDTEDDIYYDAHECKNIMNVALEKSGMTKFGWKCVVSKKKKAPSTSSDSKKISLPSSTTRNAKQLRALIIHEIGVHAKRAQNGEDTGFTMLKSGTADYADVEEGLGVLLECIVSNSVDNPAFHRSRDRYITAGLALGYDGLGPRDARQTYEIIWRLIALRKSKGNDMTDNIVFDAKNEAYDHIENAFRGTNFAMQGMIYTKLKVYREGLIKNVDYFKKNQGNLKKALDQAMIGKFNHTDSHETELIIRIKEAINIDKK